MLTFKLEHFIFKNQLKPSQIDKEYLNGTEIIAF